MRRRPANILTFDPNRPRAEREEKRRQQAGGLGIDCESFPNLARCAAEYPGFTAFLELVCAKKLPERNAV